MAPTKFSISVDIYAGIPAISNVYDILQRYLCLHKFATLRSRWHPTPVLLPGKSHAWRSLVGCSPWGRQESDTTQRLHFHFSLSRIREGNANPLQCSCLENPRDGGAWWDAVYGVAQSRTRLKRLSSSSSSKFATELVIWEHSIIRQHRIPNELNSVYVFRLPRFKF